MNKQLIILLVVIVALYLLMEKKSYPTLPFPPPPPPRSPHWSHLHPDFSEFYINLWKSQGYDYDSVKKWIKIGIEPRELELVKWIKESKGLSSERITNLKSLRGEWRRKDLPKDGSMIIYD